MEIIVGKTAGFCFGVKNATTKATEELNKFKKIDCLGELVHNKQVTEKLEQQGMRFIENIEKAKHKVIIRSHGVSKQIYEKAKEKGIEIIDLTCPKVLHIHNIAEEYSNNYYIFLIGNAKHPEIIGTSSFCGNYYTIIEEETQIPQAIENFKKSKRKNALIISQTTYSLENFNKIVEKIKENIICEKLEIKNTICNATRERQEETEAISKKVDLMIIVGGKHSSNSNKLYEIAKKNCSNVIFVETKEELKLEQIKNAKKIGIMAGASTPTESITDIVNNF